MAHNPVAAGCNAYPTLWSHGTKQYGIFVTVTDDVIVAQFDRTTKALEGTIALSTIAGNPLGLPLDTPGDDHEVASLCVAPNGVVYAQANNYSQPHPRVVRTTTAGVAISNPANWATAASEFPNLPNDVQCSYFRFQKFASSVLLLYGIRNDFGLGSVPAYGRIMRHSGGSTWTDLGNLSEGANGTEESFYSTHMYVESPRDPHPNRGHLFGAWDYDYEGIPNIEMDKFSYLYTDNEGTTWRNIAGNPVTIPLKETDTSVVTGISFGDPTDNFLGAAAAIDTAGRPIGVYCDRAASFRPHLIRWNGTAWVDEDTIGLRYSGGNRLNLVPYQGDLWAFGRPVFFTTNTDKVELRRVAAPNEAAYIAAPVGLGWYCHYDPVALHETGTVEILHVNNEIPRVFTFGNHTRAVAVA